MSERMPEMPKNETVGEKKEKNEQDVTFEKAKASLEAENLPEFFARLSGAMDNFYEAQAVAWQHLAVEIYAAGSRKFGKEEMARLYDEQFQDPDTREWLFGHL